MQFFLLFVRSKSELRIQMKNEFNLKYAASLHDDNRDDKSINEERKNFVD